MAQQPQQMASETANVLQVFVHKAEDLKAGDMGGSSDPYVELRIVSMFPAKEGVVKTKRVNHTLCPEWNETFYLHPLHPRDDVLEVKVYDHNAVSSNELLGLTSIPVSALFAGGRLDEWKDLKKPSDQQTKGRGRIHLVITYNGEGLMQLAGQSQLPSVFGNDPMHPQPQQMSQQMQQPTMFLPPGSFAPPGQQQLQPQQQTMYAPPPVQSPVAPPQQPMYMPPPVQPMYPVQPVQQPMPAQAMYAPAPMPMPMPQQQPAFQQQQQGFQQPTPTAATAGNMGYKVSHASDPHMSQDTRPMCPYGLQCYRKNPMHFREMAHPPGHPLAQ